MEFNSFEIFEIFGNIFDLSSAHACRVESIKLIDGIKLCAISLIDSQFWMCSNNYIVLNVMEYYIDI